MGNRNIPEVRFSGFAGEWEQCTLHSMVDRVKSYSLSRDVETSEYTGYKYIHYGDIHTKVADIIDEFSDLPNIKAGTYELLEKGDLVLADASEDYQGIAAPAVVTIDVPYKLVSGLHTIALRPKQVDSLFLYYLINSPIFRKYGYKTGTGMKVFGISATNLLKFESLFPVLEEQNKIGNFFKQLDDTIALHQQELTTLKQTKQGFLQKMFPKEGESVPEVRFTGFKGEWEQRKLINEIIEKVLDYRGKSPTKFGMKWGNSGYLVLSALNVKDGYIDKRVEAKYGDQTLFERWMGKERLEKGDVVFTTEAPLGNVAQVPDDNGYILNQRAVAFKTSKEKTDNNFLAQLLRSPLFQTKLQAIASGGTAKGIGMKEFAKMSVNVPVLVEEQTKIGHFFKQLDDTIALHQRELDALKVTKKAFLQKMFV
ncbi:restriction endonuclease subunit S [Bacillus spizizenii]|uniref:restriction endonuclease subunit S n=1 Tax=Bacillus spizizenii TaxID=96241 RepID=UPI00227F4233|nr:restriction endonuclease subunit S [Bacillus spizizenii]MCY8864590.1 restriction endonuclease subunit S [Bacillus spizizenii]MEC1530121.1 restriction endonuclease subunit S [Bacillus spizizenii]